MTKHNTVPRKTTNVSLDPEVIRRYRALDNVPSISATCEAALKAAIEARPYAPLLACALCGAQKPTRELVIGPCYPGLISPSPGDTTLDAYESTHVLACLSCWFSSERRLTVDLLGQEHGAEKALTLAQRLEALSPLLLRALVHQAELHRLTPEGYLRFDGFEWRKGYLYVAAEHDFLSLLTDEELARAVGAPARRDDE